MLAERVGQGGDLGGGSKWRRGWIRVGVDLIDGDVEQLGGLERARLEPPFLASQAGLPGRVPGVAYSRSMTSMTSSV